MKENIYKFIKTMNKEMQRILFDALAYRSVYGIFPNDLQEKYVIILDLISDYEQLISDSGTQCHRGAPKGNKNNRWCKLREQSQLMVNNEKEVQSEYNSGTKEVQSEYNSGTKEVQSEYKEKEEKKGEEKEESSPPIPPYKEEKEVPKREEKETREESLSENKKKTKSLFCITDEELKDSRMFCFRFPWINPKHSFAFMKWLLYKKERRQAYKSEMSLRICYNQFLQFCNDDVEKGMLVVNTSIGNNWSGLFELRDKESSNSYKTKKEDDRKKRIQEVEEIMNELQATNNLTRKR